MPHRFFTIGHSNRDLKEFIELLEGSAIELVIDVRKLPGSSRYPQFNEDTLGAALADRGIEFRRSELLTGRRPVSKEIEFEVNAWWQNRSFHNYADHALSKSFSEALTDLRTAGSERTTAVMCAEAVWWRCHRRIIADHLLAHDESVFHILSAESVREAELSGGAVIANDRSVTYPAE
ncbi:MAG: DUF488 domain-containing protein [Leucobacter sp.]